MRGDNQSAYARLIRLDGMTLAYETSYNDALVDALKRAIPFTGRRWDGAHKRWLVDATFGQTCADLTKRFLGIELVVPAISVVVATTETRLIRLEYLGRTKDRSSGEPTASGWADGSWSVVITEDVLRSWFEPIPQRPRQAPTLYGRLGIKQTATADDVKAAFRRLAIQWHPDRCHEPDAHEMFISVKHAYDVLYDENQRRRYDAGLMWEAATKQHNVLPGWQQKHNGYRAPLLCGWLLANGKAQLGQFVVSEILNWEDITDDQGRTMVSHWPRGADKFVTEFV